MPTWPRSVRRASTPWRSWARPCGPERRQRSAGERQLHPADGTALADAGDPVRADAEHAGRPRVQSGRAPGRVAEERGQRAFEDVAIGVVEVFGGVVDERDL